jgi:serine/threonine protein kinase
MAMWTMKNWSFKSRTSDVVPEADGEAREDSIWELCELGEEEESHGIDTTHKLLLAIAEARDSCLRVQTRLMTEKREFKINGEQAAYLKQRLLWGLPNLPMLDPHSNVISLLQEQAVASISCRSASWRAECNQALLFCANILGELSRIMRIGEALIVDCVGSSKDWSQLVVLESILASRSDLVATNPEKPLWSPFYLVLREFHIAHTRLEKAIGELEESCGFTFNCIPPEVSKNARDHRFNEDKRYCWLNAVKDTENLLRECTQLAKGNNKKSAKSRCANYMLNKLKFRDVQPPVRRRGGGGGGSNPNPNQGPSNPNHHNSEFLRIDNEDLVGTSDPFAHGAFGYVTERKWFKIAVAVKTMHLELLQDTKFYEEVALLARVEHPHVVRLVGYCEFKVCNSGGGGGGKTTRTEEAKNKVVMEKMSQDLRKLMNKILKNKEHAHPEELEHHVPFPPPVALDIILQLAEALKFLRIQRVMHRDIKSKNILVNSPHLQQSVASSTDRVVPSLLGGIDHASSKLQYYHIKLTDLGLARHKLPENSLCSSKMQGSTNWRAPEVFKENPDKYNWAVDIYSFAMTSYEIVSGKRPFWNVPTVTYDRLCAGERPCLPVNCQPELANLIQRCWATNPDERPNIFEVCDELQSCKEALLRSQLVWRNASASCSATTG